MNSEIDSSYIDIHVVSKSYPFKKGKITVLQDINFSIKKGEFVCLLGPSGCGKTTLLNLIAGFEKTSSGHITVNGTPVKEPLGNTVTIFQNFGLLPWRTIIKNVELALEKKYTTSERTRIAMEHLETVGLRDFSHHHPHQLSGGMKQRTAIARALAADPEIIFMDEPFGSLDAITRIKMQNDIAEVVTRQNKTVIFVTHDIEESVFLADTIVVMSPHPGTIKTIIKVPLGKHRDRTNHDFITFRNKVFDALEMSEHVPEDYSV